MLNANLIQLKGELYRLKFKIMLSAYPLLYEISLMKKKFKVYVLEF